MQRISRRSFLKGALGAMGISLLACSGLGVVATRRPDVTMEEETYQGRQAMSKVLIAYASGAGSTAEIANYMGEALSKKGVQADVLRAGSVKDVSGYDAVVLGSAVRAGKPLGEAVKFATANKEALQSLPTALFGVCLTLSTDTPETRQQVQPYLNPLRQAVTPKADTMFAGCYRPERLSFALRLIMKALKSQEGDFRNWDAIGAWAQALPATLLNA